MIYLTRYGLREWLTVTIIAAILLAVLGYFGWWWGAIPVLIPWLAVAWFFRDPVRSIPDNLPQGVMLSPADGTISAVERVARHETTGGPAVVIRIFLSVLNVHVNRAPYDGRVEAIKYTPGKFLNAQTEESARVNENNLVTIRIAGDETIGLRQISGMIARRIVCPLKVGDEVKRGAKFGMIKFGSTAEVILPRPDDVDVHVTKGRKVKGGLTLLATLAPPEVGESRTGKAVAAVEGGQ